MTFTRLSIDDCLSTRQAHRWAGHQTSSCVCWQYGSCRKGTSACWEVQGWSHEACWHYWPQRPTLHPWNPGQTRSHNHTWPDHLYTLIPWMLWNAQLAPRINTTHHQGPSIGHTEPMNRRRKTSLHWVCEWIHVHSSAWINHLCYPNTSRHPACCWSPIAVRHKPRKGASWGT